jgi:hypothetical protein
MIDEESISFENVAYKDFEANPELSNEEVLVMLHLKEMRLRSIT